MNQSGQICRNKAGCDITSAWERVRRSDDSAPEPIDFDALQSVVFGYLVRQRLTDCEREILDRFAGPVTLAFLLDGQTWLHPEGTPLFSDSLISDSIRCCGTAVVTQRYDVPDDNSKFGYRLISGLLSDSEDSPLVIGLLGPNISADYRLCDTCFGELITKLQEAYPNLRNDAVRLQEQLSEKIPTFVVQRPHNRVLAVNEALCEIADASPEQLEGLPFSVLATTLNDSSASVTEAVRIENASLPLTIVRCRALGMASAGETDSPAVLADRLAHETSRLSTALSQLAMVDDESPRQDLDSPMGQLYERARKCSRAARVLSGKLTEWIETGTLT